MTEVSVRSKTSSLSYAVPTPPEYGQDNQIQTKSSSEDHTALLSIDLVHQSKQTEFMKAYAIEALNDYFDEIADKEKIVEFVKA